MIIGIDEAGRGALAGPVVAGAACFVVPLSVKNCSVLSLITDSKKLTDTQRREVESWLKENIIYGVGVVSAAQIDELGIKPANELAMNQALGKVLDQLTSEQKKDLQLQIDGRDKFKFPLPSEDIVKGDEKVLEISAASIMAKVTRDDYMIALAKTEPQFGFETHKGYGATSHYKLLDEGIYCAEHRKSYDPLKTWLNQGRLF